MNRTTRGGKISRQASNASKAVLGRYLAAGLGATGLASVECEAAVVNVDVTNIGSNSQNISGVNAGIPLNASPKRVNDFPISGSGFGLSNRTTFGSQYQGFSPANFADYVFQVATGATNTSPFRFTTAATSSVGPSLPAGISWTFQPANMCFA